MIKIGNWLDRCDEAGLKEHVGYNSFNAMYLEDGEYKNWQEVVKAYDLHGVKELTYDGIRHIVVLEIADGSINQVLSLENADETFKIYADYDDFIFNSDGTSFIQYLKDGVEVAVYMIADSPYDVQDEDDWYEFSCSRDSEFNREIALEDLRKRFEKNGIHADVTSENTIFVAQL